MGFIGFRVYGAYRACKSGLGLGVFAAFGLGAPLHLCLVWVLSRCVLDLLCCAYLFAALFCCSYLELFRVHACFFGGGLNAFKAKGLF